jgi:hypothetical protein
LTDIRMALAANELKKPSLSTGAVGYQSEAAFQRAFKNHGRDSSRVAENAGAVERQSLRNAPVFTEGKSAKTGLASRLLVFR